MARAQVQSLIRPIIRKLDPYVPGEQPKIKGLIKLNTNENPYPPAPEVLAAVKNAVDGRLRLYPDPTAQELREELARLHRCKPENIVVGNGSDELLAMSVRCFVEPASSGKQNSRASVQYFTPSYSLYPVLAGIHGAEIRAVPLKSNFDLPPVAELRASKIWDPNAALTLVTTPNAPSGRGYPPAQLNEFCRCQKGVIVLDEAYVDFAKDNALKLALKHPHVLVARTFSKAYSLCFQRVGYFVGHPELITGLNKLRDSYNVNGLGQIAALATLQNLQFYRNNFRKIIATREKLSGELAKLGFEVFPSQTNFILARPPRFPAQVWLEKLRERRILVRWFRDPAVTNYLRITIGTEAQARALVTAAKAVIRDSTTRNRRMRAEHHCYSEEALGPFGASA
jgi:histidinol-phosphate aminotransferase